MRARSASFCQAAASFSIAARRCSRASVGPVLASAFSAILVYAQELMPGKVGLVAGLFFGLAFGIAGIGAAVLGKIADHTGIISVFHGCAYLPLLGLLTAFLPNVESGRR